MKRLLITGSRDWTDGRRLRADIEFVVAVHGIDTLVHGDCPTGADAMANQVALDLGLTPEAHPADWSIGKKAGPLRNQQMVDLGADICLAFPLGESRGTRDCLRRAEKAGIPTLIVEGNQ